MIVKISINAKNKLTEDKEVNAVIKAETSKEGIANDLGKIIYAAESMGFGFSTDEVYQEAIVKYEEIKDHIAKSKFAAIYKNDDITIAIAG
jgi:hypothetical protein